MSRYIYVAGSSEQLDRVKDVMAALEERGYTVTHNWPSEVEKVGEANPIDASDKDRLRWARADLLGVHQADVLLLLMPAKEGFGAAVELGYAIAHNLKIIVSGAFARSIFTVFGNCYDRDDLALDAEFPEIADYCDCNSCLGYN